MLGDICQFKLLNGSQGLVGVPSQTRGAVKVHNSDINDGHRAMLKQATNAHITPQTGEGGRSWSRGNIGRRVRGKGKIGCWGRWHRGSLKGWWCSVDGKAMEQGLSHHRLQLGLLCDSMKGSSRISL